MYYIRVDWRYSSVFEFDKRSCRPFKKYKTEDTHIEHITFEKSFKTKELLLAWVDSLLKSIMYIPYGLSVNKSTMYHLYQFLKSNKEGPFYEKDEDVFVEYGTDTPATPLFSFGEDCVYSSNGEKCLENICTSVESDGFVRTYVEDRDGNRWQTVTTLKELLSNISKEQLEEFLR